MFDACGSHRHAVELQRRWANGISAPDLSRLVDDGTGNAFLAHTLDHEYGADREHIPLRSPELGIRGELTIDLGSITAEVREVASSNWG